MTVDVGGRITVYIVVGAIAAALMFYAFGRIDAILGVHDAAIIASSKEALRIHPILKRQRAKMLAVEQVRQRLVDSLTRFAEQADSADSARAVAAGQPVPDRSPWRPVAAACSVVQITCAQRAADAEAETDKLAAQLKSQITVHDHRCGLWVGGGVSAGWKLGAGATLGLGCRIFP